ncbi:MAG: ARMT1-like domain-containing protein [Methanomicrobiales archaeon]|nr:ARMT1-like domain-containing protein [Methanomicrobiales archaeon]
MRIDSRCFDCLASRVAYECRLVTNDEEKIKEIVERCRNILESYRSRPVHAPLIASEVHGLAYSLVGSSDPFAELKRWNNRIASEVCRKVKGRLSTFREKALASIVGNTLDYGVEKHNISEDFLGFFEKEMEKGLTVDHTDRIMNLSRRVVYFTDNCGEVVFDRLVIDHLRRKGAHIALVVKGAPILNDATMKDAVALGLDREVDLITTTGSGDVGVNPEKFPAELREALEKCSLIVAKGMANYESLDERRDLPPVAFMMAVKCDVIAESVGVPRGSYVAILRE